MPLRYLPLQRKLVGFIFLTSLTVLLLSFLALLIYETSSFKQATIERISTVGDIIASNSPAALIYDDTSLGRELLASLRAEPDVIAAALFDKQGLPFATYAGERGQGRLPAMVPADGLNFTLEGLTLTRPITQGSARVGTLFMAADLRAMYIRLRIYGLVLLGVLIGAGALAFLLSNFFQRQISQPILELAETAKTVSEQKDYSVRAQRGSGYELGFVIEAFNTMLDQIQQHHIRIGESEERFRVVADSAPVMIWLADGDMSCTWFNQNWLTFTGRTPAQEFGHGWMENVHPDDRAQCAATYASSGTQRARFQLEFRLRHHDGDYRWLLDQGTPRYQGEEFVGYIGSCVDITTRKQAEVAIRSSEQQMRLVTDHASVFLCQVDREHRYRFANRAYAARYDRVPEELLGKHITEIIGEESYRLARSRIDSAFAGQREEFDLELPYRSLGLRKIHAVYEPERAVDGQVVGLVIVLSDMTEQRKHEEDLAAARDKAVAASRAKDDFLAALSHELRTPLNPVLLLASDAAVDDRLAPEVRADFEIIRKNVELEARLIDDLLDLTRITRGKLALELRQVDAHTIIRDTLDTVSTELAAKKITVILQLNSAFTEIRGDAVRLQQVLWNVLKNAVKFTPQGGCLTVATDYATERRLLVIRITDTGIGMVPDELNRVFEAFAQGDHADGGGSHRFGGLGLGLAITRRIVELHQGQINATSEGRDRGCTFIIELPGVKADLASASPEASLNLPAPAKAPLSSTPPARQLVLLLVEDHAPTRIALEALLKRRNFQVFSAGSVGEAQAIAGREKIDVVISDIGLPDGSGFELMTELRDRYGLKGIALTGYGMESDLIRSHAAGFVNHLTKPVKMQSLDEALASLAATT
ncbi:MAG: PAS domain S-box protein [Opitutaceae bacterium]